MEVDYRNEAEVKALVRELVTEAKETDDEFYASILNNTAMVLINSNNVIKSK